MSESPKAVFLSYASQDAEAVQRLAEALRAAGVEVWFDRNELVGGDAWDAKIRKQIRECALLIPVISRTTQARREAYFRLEWRLADERTHLMARGTPFLLPVTLDETSDRDALVPDSFLAVQWTKAPGGNVPPAFAARVRKLLDGQPEARGGRSEERAVSREAKAANPGRPRWLAPVLGGVAVAAVVFVLTRFGEKASSASGVPPAVSASNPAPTPTAPAAPVTEARKLVAQARALIDEDLFAGRESYRLAEELGQRATTLDPTDGEAWGTLARALVGTLQRNYESTTQKREQARVAVERANRLAPLAVESGLALSEYQEFSGQVADAERTARDTLKRFPEDYRCVLQLAAACEAGGKSAEALELLQRCAALPGGAVHALVQEAGILRAQSRLMEAEAAVDRSLAIAPSYRAYQMKLLLAAFDFGDLERVAPLVEQLPARLQQEDLFAAITARFWLWRREPDRALASLQRVPRDFVEEQRQFFPKGWLTGWAHQMAGRSVAAKAEWAQALAVLERRLVGEPNRRPLVVFRARLLALLGRRAEAEAALQLAVELDGTSPAEAARTEAMVRACLGDHERAIEQLLIGHADRASLVVRGAGNFIKYDPVWAAIRDDPRIRQLLADNDAQLRRLSPAAGDSSPPSAAPPAEPQAKSVAVLAFANLSEDKANEYFSDGISEELLNVLAKVPGLKVSARTSAFYFKGKQVPLAEIARQLGVAYVVEGSVRRAGDKVRIQAQLIQASDGFRVWSDTFTRDVRDVFAVQDEIAGLIAKNLSLTLGASSARRMVAVEPKAIELYVQARQAWSLRTPEGFARAEQMLNRALELSPDYVRARAALLDVVQMRSFRERRAGTFAQRRLPELDQRLAQVRDVLAIDPDLAEAYSTMGQTLDAQWEREEAGRAYRRATELNPNYATGRHWYGMHLAEIGRMDEALAELKAACDLDPFSFIILDNYGWLLGLAGRDREALQMLDRAAALNPGFDQTARARASALVALGRQAEAESVARQLRNSQRELDVWTLGLVGLTGEAKALLERMEPREVTNRFQALLAAGQREAALAALADPSGASKGDVIDLLYRPMFDSVRSDPRFIQYLAVLGIAEAHARAQEWRAANPAKGAP